MSNKDQSLVSSEFLVKTMKFGKRPFSKKHDNSQQEAVMPDFEILAAENLLKKMKSLIEYSSDGIEKVHSHLNYLEEEIQIEIESLKNELDTIYFKMIAELNNAKVNVLNYEAKRIAKAKEIIKEFQHVLNSTSTSYQHDSVQDKNVEFEERIEELMLMKQKIKFEITFDTSRRKFDAQTIYWNTENSLAHEILSSKYEEIQLNTHPVDFAILPNNRLLITNVQDSNIMIYNENFEAERTVHKIGQDEIEPYGVAVNEDGEVYISEADVNRLIHLDGNFNLIKAIGKTGTNTNEFRRPLGLFYKDQCLYVCDSWNKRIKLYDKILNHLRTICVDYEPWFLIVKNDTICVKGYTNEICFYDLDFNLKRKYNHYGGKLCELNGVFYEFDYKSKVIYCYNESGILTQELHINRFDAYSSHWRDGSIFVFNGALFISFHEKQILLKLDTKLSLNKLNSA